MTIPKALARCEELVATGEPASRPALNAIRAWLVERRDALGPDEAGLVESG